MKKKEENKIQTFERRSERELEREREVEGNVILEIQERNNGDG